MYCIKNSSDLYVEGTIDTDTWVYLEYTFNRCRNETLIKNGKEPNCKSEKEIDDSLSKGYFSYFIADYSLYPKDYSKPGKLFGKSGDNRFL